MDHKYWNMANDLIWTVNSMWGEYYCEWCTVQHETSAMTAYTYSREECIWVMAEERSWHLVTYDDIWCSNSLNISSESVWPIWHEDQCCIVEHCDTHRLRTRPNKSSNIWVRNQAVHFVLTRYAYLLVWWNYPIDFRIDIRRTAGHRTARGATYPNSLA